MTEDEIVGWHHRLNGHEFEQVPGDGGGQGRLACCSPGKESDMTERLNNSLAILCQRTTLPIMNTILDTISWSSLASHHAN